jgi:hypothetical protein
MSNHNIFVATEWMVTGKELTGSAIERFKLLPDINRLNWGKCLVFAKEIHFSAVIKNARSYAFMP